MDTSYLMADVQEPDLLTQAKAEESWLLNFLVKKAKSDYNPFEPLDDLEIMISEETEMD